MVDFGQITASVNQGFINLIAAIAIILIGLVIGRFLGKLIKRVLHELDLNKTLSQKGIQSPVEQIISNIVQYLIYFIALIMALNQLGLTSRVFHIILILVLLLLIAFLILTIKDFLPNLMAGMFLLRRKHIKPGDKITVENIKGVIQEIDLIETKILTKSNDIMIVPNSILNKNIIIKKK